MPLLILNSNSIVYIPGGKSIAFMFPQPQLPLELSLKPLQPPQPPFAQPLQPLLQSLLQLPQPLQPLQPPFAQPLQPQPQPSKSGLTKHNASPFRHCMSGMTKNSSDMSGGIGIGGGHGGIGVGGHGAGHGGIGGGHVFSLQSQPQSLPQPKSHFFSQPQPKSQSLPQPQPKSHFLSHPQLESHSITIVSHLHLSTLQFMLSGRQGGIGGHGIGGCGHGIGGHGIGGCGGTGGRGGIGGTGGTGGRGGF
jgi:hypothetical protein